MHSFEVPLGAARGAVAGGGEDLRRSGSGAEQRQRRQRDERVPAGAVDRAGREVLHRHDHYTPRFSRGGDRERSKAGALEARRARFDRPRESVPVPVLEKWCLSLFFVTSRRSACRRAPFRRAGVDLDDAGGAAAFAGCASLDPGVVAPRDRIVGHRSGYSPDRPSAPSVGGGCPWSDRYWLDEVAKRLQVGLEDRLHRRPLAAVATRNCEQQQRHPMDGVADVAWACPVYGCAARIRLPVRSVSSPSRARDAPGVRGAAVGAEIRFPYPNGACPFGADSDTRRQDSLETAGSARVAQICRMHWRADR